MSDSRPIKFNSSNVVAGSNYLYRLTLPTPYISQNEEVALASLAINYSWNNITINQTNNTFEYVWVDGTVNTVTLPDGFYQVSDISNYLTTIVMYTNLHYLVSSTGVNTYFMELIVNPVYYAISVSCTPLPSVIGTYTYPSGATWTVNSKIPQLTVLSNNFQYVIGFTSASYPASLAVGTATYIVNSNIVPQITPIQGINVTCNMVNLPQFGPSPSTIYQFGIGGDTTFGSQIAVTPNQLIFYDCISSQYPAITIAFYDQLNNPLQILDTNILATIIIRKKAKNNY